MQRILKYDKTLIFLVIFILCMPRVLRSGSGDAAGAQDHPLITRYPGSTISWYDTQIYEPYRIALSPVTGYKHIDDWLEVAGKITRINYVLNGQRSFYEVYANYLRAAETAGCTIIAKGYDKNPSPRGALGQRGFLGVHYGANPVPSGASQLLQGSASSGGSGYFAAKLERPEGTAYIVVGVAQYNQETIIAMVDIIEAKALENDKIVLDARALDQGIRSYGKVALYGIHFDHNKAAIKPESATAIAEIARLLQHQPEIKLYVVGHTDGNGAFDYNMRLSAERAQAVVSALTGKHGIEAGRLSAHGAGPLVPVATNHSDEGRAKNRRVELVLQ